MAGRWRIAVAAAALLAFAAAPAAPALVGGLASALSSVPRVATSRAPAFAAIVTRVSDGDTLWVRPVDPPGRPLKLRLVDLDAPERCQAGGPAARDALAARLLHGRVRVEVVARDAYGRAVARLWQGGADINAWLVASGHAWGQSSSRRGGRYAAEQEAARRAGRGLFAEAAPLPPWTFRRDHGPCETAGSVPASRASPLQLDDATPDKVVRSVSGVTNGERRAPRHVSEGSSHHNP